MKHSGKSTGVKLSVKDLKMAMVKDLMRVHYNEVDKDIWFFL